MKILIKSLTGDNAEILLNKNPTIGELRTAIASKLGRPWEFLEIVRMRDKQGNNLCPIYKDDSSELKLVDYIKREVNKTDLVIDELSVFVRLALGPGFYRPTDANPRGYSPFILQLETQKNKCMPVVSTPTVNNHLDNHYGARLKQIGVTTKDIPEKFFDPLTGEVNENPDPKLRFELIQFIEQKENNAAISSTRITK